MGPPVAATFLFTDLVDSTRLSTGLEASAADALRLRHFSLLRDAVIGAGGTEVKNLGDGLMVVLPSPTAALDCAVAMQQALARHNSGAEHELLVRIGISTGEATTEDGDYFGDPVIEAARLCAAASGGQILTTSLVRATMGRRAVHKLVPVGALELKGLPDPVEAWEVQWVPAAAEKVAIPLPARWVRAPTVGFVGRAAELERLSTVWKETCAGARRVAFVAGEPGIGKTRLARQLGLAAADQGGVVLLGACDESLEVPYRPWIEALSPLVADLPAETLRSLGGRQLGDLARVLSAVRDRFTDLPVPETSDAETERYLLYGAVVSLLVAASDIGPVLLALDDIQWADRQSLVLLRHVAVAPECRSLLIVATYRDGEVGTGHPLADVLASLRREGDVVRVSLTGLGDADLVLLIDSVAGEALGEVGAEFAHALYRETEGNPFFAWEVMRHLAETGWVARDNDGHWSTRELGELMLPDSVREVVERRVARLGTEVVEVLSTASVFGADFELDALADVVGRPETDLLTDLESAEQAGLVRSGAPGQFRFGHAIVRHTLYDQLSPPRRAWLHRQVAEALEARPRSGVRAAELARHWAAAVTQADPSRAVAYCRKAGDEAMASLAPDQAAEHYRRALELLGPDGTTLERCEVMCVLAEALCQAGDPAHVRMAMDAAHLAQELHETELLVRAALIQYHQASSSFDEEKCEVLEAALEAIGPEDSSARARLLSELSQRLLFVDGARCDALGESAIDMARRLGDRPLLLDVLTAVGARLWDVRRLDRAEESLTIARELADPARTALAASRMYHDAFVWCDRAKADIAFDLMEDAVADTVRPDLRWLVAYYRADRAIMFGREAQAEDLIQSAWEEGRRTGQNGALEVYASELFMLRWHQGRADEVAGLMADAAEADPNLSVLHLEVGPSSTPAELARAVADLPVDGVWLGGMGLLAESVARCGDRDLISYVYDLLAPHGHLYNKQGPLTRGPVAHSLGLLAAGLENWEAANARFGAADQLNERLQMPFYLARTRIDWARALLASGRFTEGPSRARALLESALDAAQSHGYQALQRRAEQLLARTEGDG